MKNSPRFNWLQARCWTLREIGATFRVPPAIAKHIQGMLGCSEAEAREVATAHRELCNGQVGF